MQNSPSRHDLANPDLRHGRVLPAVAPVTIAMVAAPVGAPTKPGPCPTFVATGGSNAPYPVGAGPPAPAAQYYSDFAALYDLFYAEKPYAGEAAFLHQSWQQQAIGPTERVLDVACGTGTHALELERLGHRVVAVDCSEDMLAQARHKARLVGAHVDFCCQDMRRLAVSPGGFDVVCSLFDSIGYVLTNQALQQTFVGLNRHLRLEGLLTLEFWHAPAMLRHHEPLRVRRWSADGEEILRLSESQLDVVGQACHVKFTVIQRNATGRCRSHVEAHTNRYFSVPEMDAWLTNTGFEPLAWYAGFVQDAPIRTDTWHVVVVARKVLES